VSRNSKKLVLRIRYRKPGKTFGTKLLLSRSHKRKFNKGEVKGKIMGVRKVGYEELFGLGEFNPIPGIILGNGNQPPKHDEY